MAAPGKGVGWEDGDWRERRRGRADEVREVAALRTVARHVLSQGPEAAQAVVAEVRGKGVGVPDHDQRLRGYEEGGCNEQWRSGAGPYTLLPQQALALTSSAASRTMGSFCSRNSASRRMGSPVRTVLAGSASARTTAPWSSARVWLRLPREGEGGGQGHTESVCDECGRSSRAPVAPQSLRHCTGPELGLAVAKHARRAEQTLEAVLKRRLDRRHDKVNRVGGALALAHLGFASGAGRWCCGGAGSGRAGGQTNEPQRYMRAASILSLDGPRPLHRRMQPTKGPGKAAGLKDVTVVRGAGGVGSVSRAAGRGRGRVGGGGGGGGDHAEEKRQGSDSALHREGSDRLAGLAEVKEDQSKRAPSRGWAGALGKVAGSRCGLEAKCCAGAAAAVACQASTHNGAQQQRRRVVVLACIGRARHASFAAKAQRIPPPVSARCMCCGACALSCTAQPAPRPRCGRLRG